MLLAVNLQVLYLDHKQQVSPLVIIDDWNVPLLEVSGPQLLLTKCLMGSSRVARVAVLFDDCHDVLLCAFAKAQISQLQIREAWHHFKHVFHYDVAFLRHFQVQAGGGGEHFEEGDWGQEFADEVAGEDAHHAGNGVAQMPIQL